MSTTERDYSELLKSDRFVEAKKNLDALEEEIQQFTRRQRWIIVPTTAGDWIDSHTLNSLLNQNLEE